MGPFFRSLLMSFGCNSKTNNGSHRFTRDFRQSPEGRAIQEAGQTSTGKAAVNVAREAGSRWRAMSDSEKAVCEF